MISKWKRMLEFKESMVVVIVFLTWVVVMPIIIVRIFDQFATLAVVMFALVVLGMLAAFLYFRKAPALMGLIKDERTEKCSMKASRNGFLVTVVLTAALTAMAWLRGSHIEVLDLLIWIYEWALGAYMLSYLYYIMNG